MDFKNLVESMGFLIIVGLSDHSDRRLTEYDRVDAIDHALSDTPQKDIMKTRSNSC